MRSKHSLLLQLYFHTAVTVRSSPFQGNRREREKETREKKEERRRRKNLATLSFNARGGKRGEKKAGILMAYCGYFFLSFFNSFQGRNAAKAF